MAETEHKSFSRIPLLVTLLPLMLLAAGVWYYAAKHGGDGPAPVPVSADFDFGGKALVTGTLSKADGPASLNNSFAGPRPFEALAKKDGPAPVAGPFVIEAAFEVKGDSSFKSQVMHSLKLIWLSDREDFLFVKKYLSVIRNEAKTGFYLDNGRPVAALSKAEATRSLTWCAGLIAHQAFHAYIKFHSQKKQQKVRPPLPGDKDERKLFINPAVINYTSLNSIIDMEARACSFQVEILRKIGAPRMEINALLKRAPRDFSVSHDGNYSIKP